MEMRWTARPTYRTASCCAKNDPFFPAVAGDGDALSFLLEGVSAADLVVDGRRGEVLPPLRGLLGWFGLFIMSTRLRTRIFGMPIFKRSSSAVGDLQNS